MELYRSWALNKYKISTVSNWNQEVNNNPHKLINMEVCNWKVFSYTYSLIHAKPNNLWRSEKPGKIGIRGHSKSTRKSLNHLHSRGGN